MNLHVVDRTPYGVRPWHVLMVKPQHEMAVAEQLRAKDVEEYLPLYTVRRRWRDRIATLSLPLFPRYVFCRSAFEDRLKVLQVLSVTSIVSFGGKPSPVADEEIETIKAMVSSGRPLRPWPYVSVGERVRICEGSLEGLEGILVREKSGYRVIINMEVLNRAVAVEIDRDMIRAVARRPRSEANPGGELIRMELR
jgi:transcription antitermination factor NusG